jgi:hypothetical protein
VTGTEYGDPTVARGGEILRSVVGSGVHGIAIPGTDDHDEMGVFVEPPSYVLGLRRPFEHYVYLRLAMLCPMSRIRLAQFRRTPPPACDIRMFRWGFFDEPDPLPEIRQRCSRSSHPRAISSCSRRSARSCASSCRRC